MKKSVPVGLDEYQENAVKNQNNQILIVAGPGSGKTTVLTKRLAYMISEKNVPAEKCLAITFTRKAAQEMRERLSKLLKEKVTGLNIHTFHSLCFSILKENYETLGLAEDFRVISKEEKSLYKEDELPANLLEFDELITLTLKLFKEKPDILNIYKDRFKYVSVDEYQDIDEHQYELIKLLVPSDGNILAIGDPNQAIYGFRGGSSKFFNNFKTDYPNTEIISLKNNYRSTNTIVDASNQMIECFNIISKYDKPHEKITIHTAPTDKAEAEFIVSTIENMIGGHSFFSIDSERSEGQEGNYSFSDFAILYRTSTQLKPVLEALQRSGMPYVKLSNDLLCENKHIRNLLQGLNGEFPVKEQLININGEIDNYIFKYLVKLSETFTTREEFIHEVSLLTEADTLDERADRISLMTLHASKGLEFKCVFIAGLEEGIMPLYRAQTEEEIAEEKRLLYVGMTRAEQRLFLSRAIKRVRFGKSEHPAPSPFLQKIEQDLLNLSKFERELTEQDNSNQLTLF